MSWFRDPFIVGSIFVPSVWLVITLVVRTALQAAQSSGADLLLATIAFDFAVILAPDQFSKLAVSQVVADGLTTSHVVLLLMGLMWWLIAMLWIEPRLMRNTNHRQGYVAARWASYFLGLLSWTVCWIVLVLHVMNFRGKI